MRLGLLLVLLSVSAEAQTVTADRVQLNTGPCTLRSGSGAPSSGLGAVCDTYFRTDSPYTVYVKTGASTWTLVVAVDGVATGQVLASNGSGAQPAYTATPSLTSIGGAANLTLNPTGDVVFNPTGNDLLPTTGYDLNIGALTNKFLTLHAAELWVETLVAQDTIATIGGRVLVGPTTTLTADLSSGGTSIQVKHNQIANGDRLVLQVNGQIEWLAVTSGASGSAGAYTYSVTRNLDGSGANNWTAGDAVFNTGTTGDGFIDLYSVNGIVAGSTAGPTIVGNVRTGTTYSNIEPRWAIGNLNGLYGYATDTYGTAFGTPSGAWVKIDPTNGVRLGYDSTTKIELDASGNASFVSGAVTLDENGIAIAPDTAFDVSRSYHWTVPTGEMSLRAFDNGTTQRTVDVVSSWTGTGNLSTGALVRLIASHLPSSGGSNGSATLTLIGAGGVSTATIAAANLDLASITTSATFGNDLVIYTNNGSTANAPYLRSNGNTLVIESRSDANSGGIFVGLDQTTSVNIGYGGGHVYLAGAGGGTGGGSTIGTTGSTATIYNASINTSLTLNGLASCTLSVNGSGVVGCVSDAGAKTDITRWTPGLDVITKLRPVSFRWNEGDQGRNIGFIAQDVAPVIPEAVRSQEWSHGLTLDDRAILAALVNAVQELQRRVR